MNYTIEEIEAMQLKPVSVMPGQEAYRYAQYQKEIIRQLLARVKEAERVEALLKRCSIHTSGLTAHIGYEEITGWVAWRDDDLNDVDFPSLLSALESLTGE